MTPVGATPLLIGPAAAPVGAAPLLLAPPAAAPAGATSLGRPQDVDPDIYDLCEHWEIHPKRMYELNKLMNNRLDTFETDILKLWDSFKNAREPNAVLCRKLGDMREGIFITKAPKTWLKATKVLREFFQRHKLDGLSKDSLADALYDRSMRIKRERKMRGGDDDGDGLPDADVKEVLEKLDRDIGNSYNPSAIVMKFIPGIETGSGRWKDIGKLQEAKKGELKERSPSVEKPRTGSVRSEVSVAPADSKLPPDDLRPPLPPNKVENNLLQAYDVASLLSRGKKAKEKRRQQPIVAFNQEELAARVMEAQAAPPEELPSAEAVPPAEPSVAHPSSQPITTVPTPEPVTKKAPVIPLVLSAASVANIQAKEKASANAADAPSAPGRSSVEEDRLSAEDLEMAAFATGRPKKELRKMSRAEVEALVFAVADGGNSPSKSSQRNSRSESQNAAAAGTMSEEDLEMASIATGRPVKELRKMSEAEIKDLVLKIADGGDTPERSPSPCVRSRSRKAASRSREVASENLKPDRQRNDHSSGADRSKDRDRSCSPCVPSRSHRVSSRSRDGPSQHRDSRSHRTDRLPKRSRSPGSHSRSRDAASRRRNPESASGRRELRSRSPGVNHRRRNMPSLPSRSPIANSRSRAASHLSHDSRSPSRRLHRNGRRSRHAAADSH